MRFPVPGPLLGSEEKHGWKKSLPNVADIPKIKASHVYYYADQILFLTKAINDDEIIMDFCLLNHP